MILSNSSRALPFCVARSYTTGEMPPRLLIVDDDEDLRKVLRGILEPFCEVLEAANGLDALRLVREAKPRLMILDVSMPGMDGLTVLGDSLSIDSKLIVVMLTGDTDLHVARRALEGGARTYITKPFDPRALGTEIKRLLDAAAGDPKKNGGRPWRVQG